MALSCWVLEALHEGAAGAEGRELNLHVRSLQALREDLQRGEVRHERVADVRGELAEDVERGLLQASEPVVTHWKRNGSNSGHPSS